MKKKILSLLLSLSLVVSMPASFSAKAVENEKQLDAAKIMENFNKLSSGKLTISEEGGQVFITGTLAEKQVPGKKSAIKFLEENKALFGIDSVEKNLKSIEVQKDDLGHTYAKFVQVINGVEVEGSLINVHFDPNGNIASVNGKLEENKTVTTIGNGNVSESEAIEIAKKQYSFDTLRNTPAVERVIITKDNKNYEVFKVNISYIEPTIGNYDVFVEVTSGEVVKTQDNIRYDSTTKGTGVDVLGKTKELNIFQTGGIYQLRDRVKAATSSIDTYTVNNGTFFAELVSNGSRTFNSENFKAPVSAHYNAGVVIDFYKNLFNRNSIDGQGMVINSYTNFGRGYNNAFWTGYEMVYGDGDGELFTYLSGDLDIVAHEMTHGVIQYTANLAYFDQPGALNESIADVFGVLVSTYDKYNVASGGQWKFNTDDWVVGDDVYTPKIPGDALRSLSNPTLYGQPDNMSDYQYLSNDEFGDWGGVHINSGIPNKAAYNVAKSIGMEKTARIYYRALVNYMSNFTEFYDARNCLVQAATDLYGASSPEVTAIINAFDSVGVNSASQPVVDDPYEPNDYFDTAYEIQFGEVYEAYISKITDVDIYKFTATTMGDIRIDLTNLPYDYDLLLLNSYGMLLQYSANGDTMEEIMHHTITQKGDYYIAVVPFDKYSTTQKYSLTASKSVTGVTLDKTSISLNISETATLNGTVSPADATNKNLIWESSDTSVATVSSQGVVKAVGNGTCEIAAISEDSGYMAVSVVEVATDVDLIYKNAYDATMKAVDSKTQKSINEARAAIDQLKKVLPSHNSIPTWSSLVDKVQHPIFTQIVDSILELQDKVSKNEKINQSEVNKLRILQLNDMKDDTDNIPLEYLNGAKYGWSEFTDNLQQVLLNEVVDAVVKAETDKTQDSIDAAKALIDDVSTSVSEEVVQWVITMQNRLDGINI